MNARVQGRSERQAQVAYRETIRKKTEARASTSADGGKGQYGHVKLRLEPQEPARVTSLSTTSLVDRFRKSSSSDRQGIKEALEGGILAGYRCRCESTVYDGSYHDVDSNEMAFKIAGSMVFKKRRKASPVLLEPVMAVEVVTPEIMQGHHGDLSCAVTH